MKISEVMTSVFYRKEFGYIAASYTKFIDSGIPTLVDPITTIKKGHEHGLLGDTVLNAFEISKMLYQRQGNPLLLLAYVRYKRLWDIL